MFFKEITHNKSTYKHTHTHTHTHTHMCNINTCIINKYKQAMEYKLRQSAFVMCSNVCNDMNTLHTLHTLHGSRIEDTEYHIPTTNGKRIASADEIQTTNNNKNKPPIYPGFSEGDILHKLIVPRYPNTNGKFQFKSQKNSLVFLFLCQFLCHISCFYYFILFCNIFLVFCSFLNKNFFGGGLL